MSDAGSAHVGAVFGVLGYLAETFTFLYIGQSLFTDDWIAVFPRAWPFFLWSFVALAVSRLFSVYPLVALCNWLTPPTSRKIPLKFQHVLWFSGLRGAMAFALASQARHALVGTEVGGFVGDLLVAATFVMVRHRTHLCSYVGPRRLACSIFGLSESSAFVAPSNVDSTIRDNLACWPHRQQHPRPCRSS